MTSSIWLPAKIYPIFLKQHNNTILLHIRNMLPTENILSHFDLIFKAMTDAVVLADKERRIVRINPAFSDLFGYSFEDVEGKHTEIIYPSKEAYDEQGRLRFNIGVEEQLKPYEVSYRKKNGEVFISETVGTKITDTDGTFIGFLGIIRDISPRKKLETELQETLASLEHKVAERTQALKDAHDEILADNIKRQKTEQELIRSQRECERTFHAMNDIVTILDKNMCIMKANKAAREILNIEDDHIIGKPCYSVFSGRSEPCLGCPGLDTFQDNRNHTNIITNTRLGITFQVSSSPILDENDVVEYVVHVAKDITQQLKLEEERNMYNNLVDQSNDAIYILDIDSSAFLLANKKGYENLGYSRDELIGMDVSHVAENICSRKDWRENMNHIRQYGFRLFETIYKRKDKTLFPVEVNAKLIKHNNKEFLVSVVRDISERKRADENLLQEKNKLEAVLAAMGDGLTLQDRNFKIIYQNEIHKQKHGDHVGEFCYQAYHGRHAVCEGCLLEKCFTDGNVHRGETKIETSKGPIYHEVSASPIRDGAGEIIGGIETVRDITERKQLALQLQHNVKMEAIGTLAGGIAHDFNNILSAIIGYSELAKFSLKQGSKAAEDIEQVIKAGRRAESLVKQILTFSRNDEHDIQVLSPHLLIKEALKMLRSSIPSTIKIEQSIDSECGSLKADPTKIHQILMNLCTNALHAMENQKGTLNITLSRREISEIPLLTYNVSPGPYIVLSVQDTGHGMEKHIVERIFDPYFTCKKEGKGTGLGLSVVDGIVKGYNGFITVESEPGHGASFHVHLPALKKAPESGKIQRKVEELPTGNGHILVVDDEALIANINKAILERLGYKATALSDSMKALEAIRSNPDQFDLLFTDQTMPNLSGAELAKEVLQIKPTMPIILCTGYSSVISQQEAIEIGIKQYVTKPIGRKELAKVVKEVLEQQSCLTDKVVPHYAKSI